MAGSEATSPRRSPESGQGSVPLWLVRSDGARVVTTASTVDVTCVACLLRVESPIIALRQSISAWFLAASLNRT